MLDAGHNVSRFVESGFTGTPNWLINCVACDTHAGEGAVSGNVLPAVSFWTSSVEKKNVLLRTIGPPSEKPYWLLRISRLAVPGAATGEFAESASLRLK